MAAGRRRCDRATTGRADELLADLRQALGHRPPTADAPTGARPRPAAARRPRGLGAATAASRVHAQGTGARRSPRTPSVGPALAERAALQHRDRRRNAADVPRRGRPWHRALPRGGALRRGHARAARLPAAAPQLRVDRPARSRHLRLSRAGTAGARSRGRATPACTAGGRCSRRRGRWPSATSIRTSTSAAASAATASCTWRRWAPTTGDSRPGACGRWSSC